MDEPLLSCHSRTLERSPKLSVSGNLKVSVCLRSNLLLLLECLSASVPVSPFSPNTIIHTLASVPAPKHRHTQSHKFKLYVNEKLHSSCHSEHEINECMCVLFLILILQQSQQLNTCI